MAVVVVVGSGSGSVGAHSGGGCGWLWWFLVVAVVVVVGSGSVGAHCGGGCSGGYHAVCDNGDLVVVVVVDGYGTGRLEKNKWKKKHKRNT